MTSKTLQQVSKQEVANKKESASKGRQARVGKQESASKSRQARVGKQETASKSRQARVGKQESASKRRQARVVKQESASKSRQQELCSVDPVTGGDQKYASGGVARIVPLKKTLGSRVDGTDFHNTIVRRIIGNMIWFAGAVSPPSYEKTLHDLVSMVRESFMKISVEFVRKAQGDEGHVEMQKSLQEIWEIDSKGMDINSYNFTNEGAPVFINIINLVDTKDGEGIEAWVNLDEEEMRILQANPKLLALLQ
ncbi:vinorine synthase-like protein [Tanacetum coccineum]